MCLFVRMFVWKSDDTITSEPLEISSRNFQGIILWSKGRTSSKMAIVGCTGGEKTSLVFLLGHKVRKIMTFVRLLLLMRRSSVNFGGKTFYPENYV